MFVGNGKKGEEIRGEEMEWLLIIVLIIERGEKGAMDWWKSWKNDFHLIDSCIYT